MKIGIVLAKPPSYSETFFNSKIKGLLAHGYDVTLFVREHTTGFKACKVVVAPKVCRNPIFQILKMGFVFTGLFFRFKRLQRFIALEKSLGKSFSQTLKSCFINSHLLKADLDWLHFGFSTLAIGSENVAKSIGAKMAVSCRGYDMDVYPLKHPNCYAVLWQNVDKVHAISAYMLQKAVENGMSKHTPTAIIYPAVNMDLFSKMNTRKINSNAAIKITTIARLHWIKGLDYTLNALAILKSKGVDFNYIIIGAGSEYEPLRYAVHELDLEDSVQFLGELSHQETLKHLNDTAMYLQYSHSEGFCNAVLEAQAMGCLCIVSNGGALPENVLDTKTGFVVKTRDTMALVNTISKVLGLDALALTEIKTQARKRVLSKFEIKEQQQAFFNFYE